MQWLLLGVVAIALLYLSTRYPKTAFSILGVLALAAAVIVFGTRETALLDRQKLPVAALKVENPVISPAYGGSYQFNARLVNAHPSIALREFVVSITMLDCPGDSNDGCAVIGQADARINTRIPPGQARDISRNLVFSGARPAGTLRWRYQIIETRS